MISCYDSWSRLIQLSRSRGCLFLFACLFVILSWVWRPEPIGKVTSLLGTKSNSCIRKYRISCIQLFKKSYFNLILKFHSISQYYIWEDTEALKFWEMRKVVNFYKWILSIYFPFLVLRWLHSHFILILYQNGSKCLDDSFQTSNYHLWLIPPTPETFCLISLLRGGFRVWVSHCCKVWVVNCSIWGWKQAI